MPQTVLTADTIAKEATAILSNNLVMGNNVHRAYEEEFKHSFNGYEKGESISIRRPTDFTVRDGATMQTQEVKEGKITLTVDKQKGVDFRFSSSDLTLRIEDLSERLIEPALNQLANQIDADLQALYRTVPNWVGTPGQVINSYADFYKGPERLNELAVPTDMRYATLSPADHAGLLGAQTALFITGPAQDAYRRAKLGTLGDVDTYMAQNVKTHVVGVATGTPQVNGANQAVIYDNVKDSYVQNLVTDGWSNNTAGILKAGDVFTIANVFAVNAVSKETLPFLRQFVVQADVSSGPTTGPATLSISPPIITSGAYQTVAAAPADDAAISVTGTGNTGYRQNLVFHKNAFALVMVPMAKPPGAVDVARRSYKGISVRVIPVYDGTNDVSSWRLDVLYGVKAIDPRLAVRLSGTA
jgi:hypothetical protein